MKLRRNDIVIPKNPITGETDGFYGRVWRRVDDNHVQVVSDSGHVLIYNDDSLIQSNDYKGMFTRKGKFIRMTSLRALKKHCSEYNPHFGGWGVWGRKWTKEQRRKALAYHDDYTYYGEQ